MAGKSLTIKYDQFIAILVQLCLIGITVAGKFESLESLCIFSFINTVIVMGIIFKLGNRFFSVTSMFMLFLAVFHFGQAWLYAFGGEVDRTVSYDLFSIYHDDKLYASLLFSLLCYNLISLFWAFMSKSREAVRDISPEMNLNVKASYDKKLILHFGIAFFCILLIPVMIYDYLSITITSQYGHVGLYENSGVLARWAAIESYFPLAIIMVLLGCDPKKNGWKWMYLYAIGRCIILMVLTGKRGSFIIPLLLYIFCKHTFIKKYKKKHMIWFMAAGFLLLFMISFIAYGRGNYENMNFIQFIFEKNIFIQILSELGGTFTTTILSYNYTQSHSFLEGKSFLGALSVFVPLSDTFFPELKEYISVSAMLNKYSPSGGALGGSFFAEMYINFGYYSLFLTPVFAWVINKIEKVINNPHRYSLFAVCSCIYISYGFWIYVRGNLVDVVFITKRTLYVLVMFWIYKTFIADRRTLYEKKPFNRI